MGRAPCCDKANVKKGPWSPEEDAKLKDFIEKNGTGGNWIALPQKIGLKRCGKSCRLRWLNYLRPNLKHGGFSEEEDNMICNLYISIGSRWSIIAAQLPGRTDNDIKNYWNTKLKKKLLGKQRKEHQAARRANYMKQDLKKENGIGGVVDHGLQTPYWPQQPLMPTIATPYHHNQDNQASLRKLLIKLGGKFSDNINDDDAKTVNLPSQLDVSSTYQQFNPYAANDYEGASMQGFNSLLLPGDFGDQMICNPEGLESYYGVGMDNGSSSTSWDEMGGSLINPPSINDYEPLPARQEEETAFDDLKYLGFP
ncbi:hypothetical protein ACHQM5_002026 [Ranunculus cassubicifolius]